MFTKKYMYLLNVVLCLFVSIPVIASAGDAVHISHHYGYFAIASALCISVAAVGGTLGQSAAAKSALSGIARNPEAAGKIFVPMILSLALIESLVLFSLLVSFLILY